MKKTDELEFLKKRLEFRLKLFLEYAFVDNRLIHDIDEFGKETRKIEKRIISLSKLRSKKK